ncbi:hypothetical protein AVEN_124153-1 [Araneus ventricosus]|uniref:Uncharacterized protein n=1 Tax=Araneus ventricosus TaxID=182803 RepID=A0A4Y2W8B8_ARAVE|nr:hypothetical protein AVEN_124153-1 [Araneus ventricosus]
MPVSQLSAQHGSPVLTAHFICFGRKLDNGSLRAADASTICGSYLFAAGAGLAAPLVRPGGIPGQLTISRSGRSASNSSPPRAADAWGLAAHYLVQRTLGV